MAWVEGVSENKIAQLYAARGHKNEDTLSVREAASAARQWALDNELSYNSVLPVGFRTTATREQEFLLLRLVLELEYADG